MTASTLEAPESSQPTGAANDSVDTALTTPNSTTALAHGTKPLVHGTATRVQTSSEIAANHRTAAEPRALTAIKWASWIVFVAVFTIVGITTADQMFGQMEPSAPAYVLLVDRVMLIAGGLLGALFGTMGSYLFSLAMARMLGYDSDED